MKPLLTACLILSVTVGAALAQNVDMSSVTPVLTYPDSGSETVTQDDTGIAK